MHTVNGTLRFFITNRPPETQQHPIEFQTVRERVSGFSRWVRVASAEPSPKRLGRLISTIALETHPLLQAPASSATRIDAARVQNSLISVNAATKHSLEITNWQRATA